MARKPRLEIEGGLYHLITRGVNREDIFHSPEDHRKFLLLIEQQKLKLPFYLYAYCLMTNHVHLLIERRTDDIGRIMHRVLTGYSQYYNRRYRRVGHLFQGRHKAILCESDPYLAELVRYIHLNPVRAKMVRKAEKYPYSSHRSYIGIEPSGIVDVDPVLRRFAVRKAIARKRFAEFVAAGARLGHQEQFYETDSGVLGSEEFVDATIHRIGEFDTRAAAERRKKDRSTHKLDPEALILAVANVCDIAREDFCGPAKGVRAVFAKEALILSGKELGASLTSLVHLTHLSLASVSRRYDIARQRLSQDGQLSDAHRQILDQYNAKDRTRNDQTDSES
jgi:putative transposase